MRRPANPPASPAALLILATVVLVFSAIPIGSLSLPMGYDRSPAHSSYRYQALDLVHEYPGEAEVQRSFAARSAARNPANPEAGGTYTKVLPYGVTAPSAGLAFAELLPGYNFTNSSIPAGCSSPSNNLSRTTALLLSAGPPSLLCLNGIHSGVITSIWQPELVNFTTFDSGDTTLHGCVPLPSQTHCAFYASNEYTSNLSLWRKGVPTNSSILWHPSQQGTLPTDLIFYVDLSFNGSTLPGSTYAVTVDLPNATPIPVTFYVHTNPIGWGGEANATVVFDMTAAWTTEVLPPSGNGTGTPEIVPTIPGFNLSVQQIPGSHAAVTFLETGLPSGTNWSVSLNTSTVYSTSNSIRYVLPNGTYGYVVGSSNPRFGSPSGLLIANGTTVSVAVPFSAPYVVSMTMDLPSEISWTLEVFSASERILDSSGRGNNYDFSALNGSYTYRDGTPSGRYLGIGGEFTVKGAPIGVTARFTPVNFSVRVQSNGLPSSARWSISLNGSTFAATTSQLQLEEVNGTYVYSVEAPPGYHAAPESGVVVISGSPVSLTVNFTGRGEGVLGLPGDEGYYVLGGIAVVVAAAAVIGAWQTLARRRSPLRDRPPDSEPEAQESSLVSSPIRKA